MQLKRYVIVLQLTALWMTACNPSQMELLPACDSSEGVTCENAVNTNTPPILSVQAPSGEVLAENITDYTVNATTSDPDDIVTIDLFYRSNNQGCDAVGFANWTPLAAGLVSPTSYSWNIAGLEPGTSYYICARTNDGTNPTVYALSGSLTRNHAPSMRMTQPADHDDMVMSTGSFSVTWTDYDFDDDATVSLYYKATTGGPCSDAIEIASNLSENADGAAGIFPWSVTDVAAGSYYICARIFDGINPAIETWSSDTVHINAAPTFAFAEPMASDDRLVAGNGFTISWAAADADDDATISLYLKTSATGPCNTGTLLVAGISEDSGVTTHSYTSAPSDTSGSRYVCARIDDGVNMPQETHSAPLVIYHRCQWTGAVDGTFTDAANWSGCNSSVPTSADMVSFPSSATNVPIVSGSRTVYGIGEGPGGGTIMVRGRLYLTGAIISSSLRAESDPPDCDGCAIATYTGGAYMTVNGDATLTLVGSISLIGGANRPINVGGGGTAGHLVTEGGVNSDEWPEITGCCSVSSSLYGLRVIGVSPTERSSIRFDGVIINKVVGSGDVLRLGPYFDILQFDRAEMGGHPHANQERRQGGYVRLLDCTGSASVAMWNNLRFIGINHYADPLRAASVTSNSYGSNVRADDPECTAANGFDITISGSGDSYGPVLEVDPQGIIAWANGTMLTCTWTGATSTSWSDPSNWSGCANGRGNYPDQNDWAIIPSAAAQQPTIDSGRTMLHGFGPTAAEGDGGTVTLAAGAVLKLFSGDQTVRSSVNLVAHAPSCTTCMVDAVPNVTIINDATLTIHSGITLRTGFMSGSAGVWVGDGASGGRFATGPASSDPSYWPRLQTYSSYRRGIILQGSPGHSARLKIDGLHSTGVNSWYEQVTMTSDFIVEQLDRLIMDANGTTRSGDSRDINIGTCAGSSFDDKDWEDLDFVDPMGHADGRNVAIPYANCAAGGPLTISPLLDGANGGYGPDYELDANDMLNWQ